MKACLTSSAPRLACRGTPHARVQTRAGRRSCRPGGPSSHYSCSEAAGECGCGIVCAYASHSTGTCSSSTAARCRPPLSTRHSPKHQAFKAMSQGTEVCLYTQPPALFPLNKNATYAALNPPLSSDLPISTCHQPLPCSQCAHTGPAAGHKRVNIQPHHASSCGGHQQAPIACAHHAGVMDVKTQGDGSESRRSSVENQPIPNPSPFRFPCPAKYNRHSMSCHAASLVL